MKRFLLVLALIAATGAVSVAEPLIFIVRHAEKATNDPKDPDLSRGGQERAEWLAATLKDAGVSAIYTTEFKRTKETAEPLSRAAHVDVTVVAANDTAALIATLKEARGNALVVAHSNTIPEILKALGVTASVALADNDYNDLFVVAQGSPPSFARLHLPTTGD